MAAHRMRSALLALACLAAVAPASGSVYDVADLSIGNRVFFDDNDNGRLDAGERGVAGWSVRLIGADGVSVLATRVTDEAGYYRFDSLPAGTYSVEVALPGGYRSSTDVATTADPGAAVDSDDNGIGALGDAVRSGALTLGALAAPVGETDLATAGQGSVDARADMTVDFGIVRMAVLPVFFIVPPVTPPTPPPADLAVSASGPKTARPGQIVEYRVVVRNTSRVAARGVVVLAQLPSGTSVVETVRVQNARRPQQRLALGTIKPRTSKRLRLRLRFIAVLPGMRLTLDASATARNAATENAAATVRVVRPTSGSGDL